MNLSLLMDPVYLILGSAFVSVLALVLWSGGMATSRAATDLSPASWPKGEYERFLAAQDVDHTEAGVATGQNGAVTVAYNGIGMVLAATGNLHPVVAALLMGGSSAVVGWRAWRGASCHPTEAPSLEHRERWHPWMLRVGFLLQAPLLTG